MDRLRRAWRPIHLRILLLLLAASILLLMPLPRSSRELDVLGDLGHAPLFGMIAALLYFWFRPWLPRWNWLAAMCVWVAVSGLGIGIEFLQAKLGRHSSWSDAYANMLGAAAFLIWCLSHQWQGKVWRTVGIITGMGFLAVSWRTPMFRLADALVQRSEMPLIASFERKIEITTRWQFQHCRIAQSSQWASEGRYSLLAEMQPAKYPSISLYWPVGDWSAYETLTFDYVLSGSEPLPIVVKIEDDYHGREVQDRYNGRFVLRPHEHTIRINLLDVAIAPKGRTLNLRRIRRLQIFTADLKEPRRLFLDNVRLQP